MWLSGALSKERFFLLGRLRKAEGRRQEAEGNQLDGDSNLSQLGATKYSKRQRAEGRREKIDW
jgi:hypothetical protein